MAQVPIPANTPECYKPGWLGSTSKKMVGQMQENIPGLQHDMIDQPLDDILVNGEKYKAAGKLVGKNALITGADSGIGRATAILFAYEGASLLLHYVKEEQKDMDNLTAYIKEKSPSTKFETIIADLSNKEECHALAAKAKEVFNGKVDILFNNAGTQNEVASLVDLPDEQWEYVFKTNIHAIFYLTKALLPMMPWGSSIINNASINPFVGHPKLVDYTATKGAIVGFTRALSNQVVKEKGIRVNAICPGPILTPLVLATMGKESLESFGVSTAIGRPGQPVECATCVVFLASYDSTYVTAQCM
ncbi:hypothetical protein QFC22_004973 [Naganishia vaughanmartiniae]|uniref:Uncharacterized protein n=1 Tax=Naganishia vaughanmartiniae TaxID=1424756 RepID=A0ACC2WXG1_9TREE|nr:hypothetical protein QFC22_004973 [Naganishia vaughanmartiniae]